MGRHNRIMGRNKKCICLFKSNKKLDYTILPRKMIFASEDIYIFETINTYQQSRKENNSTLKFDNDP